MYFLNLVPIVTVRIKKRSKKTKLDIIDIPLTGQKKSALKAEPQKVVILGPGLAYLP